MKITEVLDEEGETKGWRLWVGDVPIFCETREEAEHLEKLLMAEKNCEILDLLQGQEWDEDILEALKKQHLIFKAMILTLLGREVRGAVMAAQMVWQAFDTCQYWHQCMKQQPAWHAKLKNSSTDTPRG